MAEPTLPREPPVAARALDVVRELVEPALEAFLLERRAELEPIDAAVLVDEIRRLVRAGGKRFRPALCFWAFRAAGGREEGAVVRASAAIELLHTFALVHDDVMDASDERRGVASTHARFATEAPAGTDPRRFGLGVAILVGDLAAALADRLLRTCGAEPGRLAVAQSRFDAMRVRMAAGQFLDLARRPGTPLGPRVAELKTGSYTAEGPVSIGTALAGAGPEVEEPLARYARLVGRAFQLRDDVLDRDAGPASAAEVDELIGDARAALEGAPLVLDGAGALDQLASLLRLPR